MSLREELTFEMPDRWNKTQIGEILTLEYGDGLPKRKRDSDGEIPVYGSSGITGYHSEALIDEPCLVVGRKGSIGAVHLSDIPCWPIDTTYYIIPPEKIDIKFLYYYLSSLQMERLDKSTSIPSLSRDDVHDIEIGIPSIEEQKRVVSKIEELLTQVDAGENELKETSERLKIYRQALLDAGVTGRLSNQWRESTDDITDGEQLLEDILDTRRRKWDERFQETFKYQGKDYTEPEGPQSDDLLSLPDRWTWTSINQLSYVIGGLTKNKDQRSSYPHEVPYLRVANVYANELRLDEIKTIKITDREKNTRILDEGDLLIVEGNGSKDQIGRVALWDGSIEPCSHQNHLIRVKILEEELRQFVLYWLLSARGRNYITQVASSTSGLYTLSLSKVRRIPVPLPPLEEVQYIINEIEKRLSIQQQVKNTVEEEYEKVKTLHNAVLKAAFEGKLVPDVEQSSDSPIGNQSKHERVDKQLTLEEIEGEMYD